MIESMMDFQALFEEQKGNISHFFDLFDQTQAKILLDQLAKCKGVIFCTGIGKSSLVAKKIAVTMTSTGTRALFLSPTNALHGDIGIVSKEDIFLFFSKGGESEELLNLIPFIRNKGAALVAIVCKEGSHLEEACDSAVVLPLKKELCPFDLAPTTSAAIQMIFGDVLTVALMKEKGFNLEQYQQNHPAGRIGRRMTLRVEDLMLTGEDIPSCFPEDLLVDLLVKLSNKKCGCLVVVDEQKKLQGIFTDGDLRRALQTHGPKALEMKMEVLSTKSPRSVPPQILAVDAMKQMESKQKQPITVLPVVSDEQTLMGLIKMHDILQSGV